MITVELRPSIRLVQLIAALERFTGRWERLAEISTVATAESHESALADQTVAAFLLDSTTPSQLALSLKNAIEQGFSGTEIDLGHPLLSAYRVTHTSPLKLDSGSIEQLYLELTSGSENFNGNGKTFGTAGGGPANDPAPNQQTAAQIYRSAAANFTLPAFGSDSEELVFQTVPPFLVRQRTEDLLAWLNRELEAGSCHPLFLIGTFHLLFLQTMPFCRANHRLSLNLVWRLLDTNGYSFVRHTPFASALLERNRGYLQSLRQAEKTVFTTWTTLNIWLEFFLEALVSATSTLAEAVDKGVEEQRLTRTQRNIIDIIRTRGPVTREIIVTESGINVATVKYNLTVLSERGYLKRTGGGRTTSYWVS